MTSYSEWTQQVGDQWVAALKRAEDAVGKAQDASKVDLPPVQVPEQVSQFTDAVTEHLPKPSEIVEANFALTSRLLEAQRELTLRLLAASGAADAAKAGSAKKKA